MKGPGAIPALPRFSGGGRPNAPEHRAGYALGEHSPGASLTEPGQRVSWPDTWTRRARGRGEGGGLSMATAAVEVGGQVEDPRFAKVVVTRRERAAAEARCLATLRQFAEALFRELKGLLDALRAQGIAEGGEPTTAPLPEGLRLFTFEWEGSRVIVAPYHRPLAPRPDNEAAAKVVGTGACGRIIVFLQPRAVRDHAAGIQEIFVSPQGRYFANGLGSGSYGQVNGPDVAGLAMGLLHRLTFDLQRWHSSLDRTTFDFVSQEVDEPIGFKLVDRSA